MLFICVEDFFAYAKKMSGLTREEERRLAREMPQNKDAREKIMNSYLPMVASCLCRVPEELRTLRTLYACLSTLEKGVDSFDFLQDSEAFSHHLSWRLRQCITRCIADR